MYKVCNNDEYDVVNYGVRTHTIVTDSVIIDNDGDEKIVHKLREKVGDREKPDDKFVTKSTVSIIDSEGHTIEKDVFIDDKRNVVEEK
jgi:hypothetical protein